MPAWPAGGGVLRRAGAAVHGPHRAFAQRASCGAEHPPRPVAHGAGAGVRHGDHGGQGRPLRAHRAGGYLVVVRGWRRWLAFAEGGGGSYSPKGMLETVERDGGSSWQGCSRTCCRVFHILQSARQFYSLTLMTQDERWLARYNEVMSFMEENHRNPPRGLVRHDGFCSSCRTNVLFC